MDMNDPEMSGEMNLNHFFWLGHTLDYFLIELEVKENYPGL